MLEQRNTLVGLLKSLLKSKNERDHELEDWVSELSCRNKSSGLTAEDFWLLQYQKLMKLKPASITEAEKLLDAKVFKVLSLSNAVDLAPLFAKFKIDFNMLLAMSVEDFANVGIGSATYHVLQRSLHSFLSGSKLRSPEPSAPLIEDATSTLDLKGEDNDSTLGTKLPLELEYRASAPQLEAAEFFETECVVCLSNDSRVLFIPCGHVCACTSCCQPLLVCPLCRSEILNKCYIKQ